jgi:hypothetical protein
MRVSPSAVTCWPRRARHTRRAHGAAHDIAKHTRRQRAETYRIRTNIAHEGASPAQSRVSVLERRGDGEMNMYRLWISDSMPIACVIVCDLTTCYEYCIEGVSIQCFILKCVKLLSSLTEAVGEEW